jgi:hypothetical protein
MTTSPPEKKPYLIGSVPKPFKKRFDKKSNEKQAAILKALSQLAENPRHTSLRAQPLTGTAEWYARSSSGDRIFFTMEGNRIDLITNCNHDMIRKR